MSCTNPEARSARRAVGLNLPLALLLALSLAPASAQLCGDCNENAQVSVLDALAAAQHDVGLIALTGQGLINCNVDGQGPVSILDALLIGQCVVGLLGSPCGLACSGLRVVGVAAPPGTSSGDVLVSYTLLDDVPPPPPAQPVDVLVTFSTDGGGQWTPASQGAGGDPVTGLLASATGQNYIFSWDSLSDGVGRGCTQQSLLRLAPVDSSGPGLAGGSTSFSVENSLGFFLAGPDLPGSEPLQEHLQLPLLDGRVLLCGGTDATGTPTARTLIFDPLTETFTQVGDMHVPRVGHVGVVLTGGAVWVAGGASSLTPGPVLEGSVEYLDPATGTWTLAASVPLPTDPTGLVIRVAGASALYLRGRGEILLCGGVYDDGAGTPVVTNSAVRYQPYPADPALGQTDFYVSPRFARYQQTLTLLPGADSLSGTMDDLALVYGGSGQDPADPPTAPLPGQTAVHSLHVLGDAEILDLSVSMGQWHQVIDNAYYRDQQQLLASSSVLGPRRDHAAVLLGDGTVLLVGGHAEVDEDPVTLAPRLIPVDDRLRFAERVFPDQGSLALSQIDPAGITGFLRVAPRATLLGCGTVLLTGGYDYVAPDQPTIADVETFDPSVIPDLAWSSTQPLLEGRWLHGATRLPDGRVLVAGGEGGTSPAPVALATTELYEP